MDREEKLKKVAKLRGQGLSYAAIADLVGIHKSTVRSWLLDTSYNGPGRPCRSGGEHCTKCGKPAEDTYRNEPICRKCLCGDMPEATIEEQLAQPYGESPLAIAHNTSTLNDTGYSRKGLFSKQLDKAMEKRGIKRTVPHEWVLGAEW